MLILIRLCALIALLVPAAAQATDVDTQLWLSARISGEIGGGIVVAQDMIFRLSDDRDGLYEVETATALGHTVAPGITALFAYVHNRGLNSARSRAVEHRARQQINIDTVLRIGTGTVSFRGQMEQRWREGMTGTGWRLRPNLRFSLPLDRARRTTITIGNELFINASTTRFQRQTGIESVRNNISVQRALGSGIVLEAGYMNQHRFVQGQDNVMNNIITVSTIYRF